VEVRQEAFGKVWITITSTRQSRPMDSDDGAGRRRTPTERADQKGAVEIKHEVEKKYEAGGASNTRPEGQWQGSLGHGLVVAVLAVEG